MKFTPDAPALRRPLLAAALVALIAAGGAAAFYGWTSSPDENRSALMVCDKCGHQFRIAARDYHAAGEHVRCPKCSQGAAEPVLAVCPHCTRPIRYGDIPQGSEIHTRRLCPFCQKPMP